MGLNLGVPDLGFGEDERKKHSSLRRKRVVLVLFLMAALVFLAFGIVRFISRNPSGSADLERAAENIKRYNETIEEQERVLRGDQGGGESPEETIRLLAEALREEDVERAVRFFAFRGGATGFSKEELTTAFLEAKAEGKLAEVAKALERAEPYPEGVVGENDYKFISRDEAGEMVLYVNLERNPYSGVWKVESL